MILLIDTTKEKLGKTSLGRLEDELTIKENADGSFMYMGNKIQNDGINRIPDYQYRIRVSN